MCARMCVLGYLSVCKYQVHHHVHVAEFVGVDAVNKLLDLLKGGPLNWVVSSAPTENIYTVSDTECMCGAFFYVCTHTHSHTHTHTHSLSHTHTHTHTRAHTHTHTLTLSHTHTHTYTQAVFSILDVCLCLSIDLKSTRL